jgi:hypothetical protein
MRKLKYVIFFRELLQALGLDLSEATAVPVERGHPPGELLPAAHDEVHVLGIDLQSAADSPSQFRGHEAGAGSEERIIDRLSTFGVIQDGAAHELDWLLGSVTGRSFFRVLPPKGFSVATGHTVD